MKKTLFIICLLASVLTAAALTSACTSTSPIEQAVMCSKVTQTGGPEVISDTFAPDVSSIYCSIKLRYTSAQSKVKGEWYVVSSDEADLKNSMIGQGSVVAGTEYVVLQFARSDKLLPKGDYEVKLYFDDEPAQSVPFTIKGEASPSAANLTDATMCTSLDLLTEKPLDKVDVFPSDVSKVFCAVKVNDADFNSVIKARWTYIGGELENLKGKVIYEPSTKVEGREYISFSIGMQSGKQLPTGQYDITLFIDGDEQMKLPFSVVAPDSIKWPYISEMSTFSYTDEEQKTATLTSRFTTDDKQINFRARAYNAPQGTVMNIQWILDRSADAVIQEKLVQEDKNQIEGSIEIRAALITKEESFVKGDYLVKIIIDDEEMGRFPFKVE
ncbi:MAG: hypothetical protein JXA01_03960 [Dehalococcoidia bacterium]|nr:hypothetical protein [Dehalococcoidia bacterium]